MAKKSGKKFRYKEQTLGGPMTTKKGMKKKTIRDEEAKAIIPVSAPSSDPSHSSARAPTANDSRAREKKDKGTANDSRAREKDKGKLERLSGFIFMCSGITKPECYTYHVFGLPAGNKEVVEKIKPGTKLFLFDFDLKLLYGVYNATTSGRMNLEPAAFRGKFPAQVRYLLVYVCPNVRGPLVSW